MINDFMPEPNEKIIFALRSLYNSRGYSHYKMSKFEEYDLYSGNKDFLVSDGVITFTDTNGKLMALKPDVTLSIVKNTEKSSEPVEKLYYTENVYRVSKSTRSFRELMQVGLECIGEVDGFCVSEVLSLAMGSLKEISESCVLDISDLDILTDVLTYAGIPENGFAELFGLIGEKNTHELTLKCMSYGIAEDKIRLIKELITLHGAPEKVFGVTDVLLKGVVEAGKYEAFKRLIMSLPDKNGVNIDFSVTDDINYYNGVVFKGFIQGVPNSVLSGGQYDSLMRKMRRTAGAVGFAVYTDMLERLFDSSDRPDADTVLLYDETDGFEEIHAAAERLRKQGESVFVSKKPPEKLRYGRIIRVNGGK